MISKELLTRTLVDQLQDEARPIIDEAMVSWWCNIRRNGGFRLTDHGYFILSKQLKIAEYSFQLDKFKLTSKNIFILDKRLKFPYYIEMLKKTPKNIILFGDREAVLLQLYDNDIEKFLINYEY